MYGLSNIFVTFINKNQYKYVKKLSFLKTFLVKHWLLVQDRECVDTRSHCSHSNMLRPEPAVRFRLKYFWIAYDFFRKLYASADLGNQGSTC